MSPRKISKLNTFFLRWLVRWLPARRQFILVYALSLQVSRALILLKWLLLWLIDPFHSAVVIWLEWDIYHTCDWRPPFRAVSKTTITYTGLKRAAAAAGFVEDAAAKWSNRIPCLDSEWAARERKRLYCNHIAIDGGNSIRSLEYPLSFRHVIVL